MVHLNHCSCFCSKIKLFDFLASNEIIVERDALVEFTCIRVISVNNCVCSRCETDHGPVVR